MKTKRKEKLHNKMKKKTNLIKLTAETEKMATPSLILQKKLSELESKLADVPFHDIMQRFVFLNNLLQQEIASGQPQNSDELLDIERRFTALQAEFRSWNGEFSGEMSPEKLPSDYLAGETIGSKRDASTQVVPYDDDDSGDVPGEETPEKEEAAVVMVEKVWGKMVKYSVAFGCGMIVGVVCMANLFFISYYHHNYLHYEPLIPPPT